MTTSITRLNEIEARLNAASANMRPAALVTPDGFGNLEKELVIFDGYDTTIATVRSEADQAFFANARRDIAWLIQELRNASDMYRGSAL